MEMTQEAQRTTPDHKASVDAESAAADYLRAAKTKADVVRIVMNEAVGPGSTGVADDFGAAVEMALKAVLAFRKQGPASAEATYGDIRRKLRSRDWGHNAATLLSALPSADRKKVEELYDECVEQHQAAAAAPTVVAEGGCWIDPEDTKECSQAFGPNVEWPPFERFAEWIKDAPNERYNTEAPAIQLPLGGTVQPGPGRRGADVRNFADMLIEWAEELMEVAPDESLRDTIERTARMLEARARAGSDAR